MRLVLPFGRLELGLRTVDFAALPCRANRNGKPYKHKLREQSRAASATPSG